MNSCTAVPCQHLGSIGFVGAVEVQVKTVFGGGLDEVHVGADEVRHDCSFLEENWVVVMCEKFEWKRRLSD